MGSRKAALCVDQKRGPENAFEVDLMCERAFIFDVSTWAKAQRRRAGAKRCRYHDTEERVCCEMNIARTGNEEFDLFSGRHVV